MSSSKQDQEKSTSPILQLVTFIAYILARIGDGTLFALQSLVALGILVVILILIPFLFLERLVDRWMKQVSLFIEHKKYEGWLAKYKKITFLEVPKLPSFPDIQPRLTYTWRTIGRYIAHVSTVAKKSSLRLRESVGKNMPHAATILKRETKKSTALPFQNIKKQIEKHYVAARTKLIIQWEKLRVKTPMRRKSPKPPKLKYVTRVPFLASVEPQWQGFFAGIFLSVLFIFIPYNIYLFLRALPNPALLAQKPIAVTTQIFDRDGKLLYEIYGDQNRKPIPLAQIPDIIKQSTIAIEDREFYRHQGISLRGILRATRENVVNNHVQGGSTITQQLIKNALLTPEQSYTRKIKEAFLALWAEGLYSKNQILEMYLNQVPYGGTAWGIEAAAETYFGKKVAELTLAQAALLAGLPAAPTLYSPHGAHPELAKQRQEDVLRRMVEDGYISTEKAEQAKNEQLVFRSPTTNIKAPHFVMYVKQKLVEQYGQRLVEQGGLRITTTLDLDIQEKSEEIVAKNIEDLRRLRVGNGATIITNPKNGEIIAMVGSKNYFNLTEDGNVNVTTALRQPGSSIKLINYVAALEKGFTAASIIDDTPIAFNIPGQPPYAPQNYDGKFHGKVPLRIAFGSSYNIPAVRVLNQIGVTTMIDMGRRMGINTWNDESRFGLSLTLGGGEVTMLDMATAYGVIADKGIRTDLDPILEVKDYKGKIYDKHVVKKTRVVSEEISYITAHILSDNNARMPAFGPSSALVIPGKTVSVKTGTTDNKRDNWTIGFTPSYVVAVWVGNNDNSPMDPYLTSGVTGAAPIWNQIMTEIIKDKADEKPEQPKGIVTLPCYGWTEYFVAGTEPKGGCGPLPKPSPSASPTPNP